MIRKTLAVSLVVAPILFTAAEYLRLDVEQGTDNDAQFLAAVVENRSTWEMFGWLVLITAPVWLAATLGLIEALRENRESWATIASVFAIAGALGWAMHQTAYVETAAVSAEQFNDHRDAAIKVWSGAGGTGLEDFTIILMGVGLLLGVLTLLLGAARAGLIPWWAFVCAPAWILVAGMSGGAAPIVALGNLVLLPPFALVARHLTTSNTPIAVPA
jgi:hypothetical protein